MMNSVASPTRNLGRHWLGLFSIVVTLLALSVAIQAVRAKTPHAYAKSPQTVYFSASVKIANLAPSYSATPEYQALLPEVFAIQEQQPARAESGVDPGHTKKSQPTTSRLLRSPPESL